MSDFYIVMQFIIDSVQFALIWCLFAKLKEVKDGIK